MMIFAIPKGNFSQTGVLTISAWGSALFIFICGHARASVEKWVLWASRSLYTHTNPCTANCLTLIHSFMERYTFKLQLPKILYLRSLPGCPKKEEESMMHREIFLHTPTGGLVEIFTSEEYFIEEKYMQMPFQQRYSDKEIYNYTAVLLNKPHSISNEDGLKAMQEVAKWYIKHDSEYDRINSLKWIDYPDWIREG